MYVEKLKNLLNHKYDISDYAIGEIAFSTEMVFVGKTPFAEKASRFYKRKGYDVAILDTYSSGIFEDIEIYNEIPNDNKDRIYIHCSRPYMDRYMEMLEGVENQTVYQRLLINTKVLDSHPYAYTHEKIIKQANHIIDYKNEYLELLDSLADEKSRELLARILLFRLTFDYTLNKKIKSPYPHYFERDLFSFSDEEVFVDGGGFIGDTLEVFLKECQGHFKSYYLFEPEKKLFEKAKDVSDLSNVYFFNSGLYDKETTLSFQIGEGSGNGTVVSGGGDKYLGCVT